MAVFLNDPIVNRTEAHLVSKSLVVSMALYSKRKRMEGVWATQMNHPSRRQHERRRSSLVLLKTTKHSTKGASVDLGSDSPPMPPVRDPNKTALEDKTLVGTPLLLTPIQFVETQSIVVELDDCVVWIQSNRAVLLLRHSAGRPLLWQLSMPSGMVAVYFEEKEAPTPMKARYLRPWSASVSAPARHCLYRSFHYRQSFGKSPLHYQHPFESLLLLLLLLPRPVQRRERPPSETKRPIRPR